ncbi:7548_t:CDS:1 [Diversispora eburnea]|uniref:Large ribosomal subunit protein uL30m n=1 Tax=Diversispora eburnea TaxID=1213867 RepID=A0A9N8YNE2_9GLOM|nr:7548_t:CDS:1 [Diversispora eburnea]
MPSGLDFYSYLYKDLEKMQSSKKIFLARFLEEKIKQASAWYYTLDYYMDRLIDILIYVNIKSEIRLSRNYFLMMSKTQKIQKIRFSRPFSTSQLSFYAFKDRSRPNIEILLKSRTDTPHKTKNINHSNNSIFSSNFNKSIPVATELHNYSLKSPTILKPSSLAKMEILARSNRTRLNTISTNSSSNKVTSHVDNVPKGFFKITLRRSTIGMPRKLRAVVKALGLKRLSQTIYHAHTPIIAGMILKVKELLEVSNVKKVPTPEERKHRTEPGYVILERYQPNSPVYHNFNSPNNLNSYKL